MPAPEEAVTLFACLSVQCTVCISYYTVRFQMSPQIACLLGYKLTLVALVGLSSTMRFQMCPESACMGGCIVTLVALVCVFSDVSSTCLAQKMHSCIGCICLPFLRKEPH